MVMWLIIAHIGVGDGLGEGNVLENILKKNYFNIKIDTLISLKMLGLKNSFI